MITLEDVLEYVRSLDPDTEFFTKGYATDCPVARYGSEELGWDDCTFNGKRMMYWYGIIPKTMSAEKALVDYVDLVEATFNVNGDPRLDKITAEEFLSVLD